MAATTTAMAATLSAAIAERTHDAPRDFHYKLPGRGTGMRPGAHAGSSLGTGQAFAAHRRLFDHPDPRRLDLRASLQDVRGDWLVRLQQQRVAVPVHAVVDVSASMRFGAARSKLQVAADFAEALGQSAFRSGDPVGLLAYDHGVRDDLGLPARHSRGAGSAMAALLRDADATPARMSRRLGWRRPAVAPPADGLHRCAERLAGRRGLVFLVSDFHGPLDALDATLDLLAGVHVVPLLAWDPAETTPPAAAGWLAVRDAETGAPRTLWLRDSVRRQWTAAVTARRAALQAVFGARGLALFDLHGADGRFDAEGLTRHFLEAVA